MGKRAFVRVLFAVLLLLIAGPNQLAAQLHYPFIWPEQRTIELRQPVDLPLVPIPATPPPATVSSLNSEAETYFQSLDEAIRTALMQSEVVRVLAGVTAQSTGRTIYDVAIANTANDEQRAQFDPRLQANNQFQSLDNPQLDAGPVPPAVVGTRTDTYDFDLGLTKSTVTGGRLDFGTRTTPSRFRPGALEQNPSSVDLSYTQPLLQGGGTRANLAPLILAQIDTERSYFQYKDSIQELVRGVIEGYWRLVLARTNVWVREQQIAQLQEASDLAQGRFRAGFSDLGTRSQARVALLNAESALIAARASQLDTEAALRNLLGLPPYDPLQVVPTTPPREERVEFDWNGLLEMAAVQRPDIIELKLILEADQQQLYQAENQAYPRVDALALYRWNGLDGEIPTGRFSSRPGQFADWAFSINFSVPLGLRAERARLRTRELLISRDRANLDQALHATSHTIALSLRQLDSVYEQYLVFKAARDAARINLDQQLANFRSARVIFLNVLQAISDWGNAVNAEAQFLLQYNIELANLERQTGTILESHGVGFYEESFGSLGPWGRHHAPRCYPGSLRPSDNEDRYENSDRASEESFRLESPVGLPPAEPTPPPIPTPTVPTPTVPTPTMPRPIAPTLPGPTPVVPPAPRPLPPVESSLSTPSPLGDYVR